MKDREKTKIKFRKEFEEMLQRSSKLDYFEAGHELKEDTPRKVPYKLEQFVEERPAEQRRAKRQSTSRIEKRKMIEEALEESEEKFWEFVERSSGMIFRTDHEGTVTYVSPAAGKIFGFKPQEMVGTHFNKYLAEPERPRVSQRFAERLNGKDVGMSQAERLQKDKSHGFFELTFPLMP